MSKAGQQESSILPQLDWKSQTIIQAIHRLGGTATTTEIKENTGLDSNDDINYRYRRATNALEPHGLIDVTDPLDSSQRNPPFEATLTEKGETLAKRLVDRNEGPNTLSLEDRFEKIETTLNSLETTVDERCNRTETPGDAGGDDLDARLTALEQRLDHLEETLDGEHGAWSAEKQHDHEVLANGFRAVRDLLLDKHEDEFKQYIRKYEE
jgi:uncharacterized coiled-coil protein SlyX